MTSATIEDYLARGGRLTAPDNAPPRYRAEILRLMATFIDSELAAAAGFADQVNAAPGLKARIAAARIVLEKLENADRVMSVMTTFGADARRYLDQHDWTARLPRGSDIGAARRGGDMRLNVLHYPVEGWIDAVVMNVLMGEAVVIQLDELSHVSYQPLAEAFSQALAVETAHLGLGVAGLKAIQGNPGSRKDVAESLAYWRPRVADSFGTASSQRFEMQKRFGLRRRSNEELRTAWQARADAIAALAWS